MSDELKGKKLLVLGGTRISCEIIRKAQEMGLFVIVTDYNQPKDSPGKLIANQYFNISATDVDQVAALIKRESIDGVLTGFADVLLPYYAKICYKTQLPAYATEEQFRVLVDKQKYIPLFKNFGVPVPDTYDINFSESIGNKDIKFPVIVKPSDSSGARGVFICHNYDQLTQFYSASLNFSKTKSVRIEQLLEGPEVTAFYLVQNGRPIFLGLANRHVENNQEEGVLPLPVGYTFPSVYTKRYIEAVVPKVYEVLKDINLTNGLLFMQCIVDDGVPKVYDVGLRLTGSLEYYIFDKIFEYNPLEMLIRFSITGNMGEAVEPKIRLDFNGVYGWNISFLMKPGTIEKIEGLEIIQRIPGVINAVDSHVEGETLPESAKGLLSQICCRVLGYSRTFNEMETTIERVTQSLRVLDESGNSLLLPALVINKYKDTIMIKG